MDIHSQQITTPDVASVSTIIVSWLGVIPLIVSVIASVVATAWIIQRWRWQYKDRKRKNNSEDK